MSEVLPNNDSETSASSTEIAAQPSRFRKWWRILLFASPLVLLLVAPTIVAKTSLRNHITGWVLSDFPGSVKIGHASLSWFATVDLSDVSVTDAQGETIAHIPAVKADRTLWQLATGRYDRGIVRILQPNVQCRMRSDGSNLEDALMPMMQCESQSGSMPPLTIEVQEGEVTFSHTETGSRSQIQNITGVIELVEKQPLPNIDVIGVWTAVGAPAGVSGNGAVMASLKPAMIGDSANGDSAIDPGTVAWHFEANELAAGYLEPLLQRIYPQARLAGFVNAKADVNQAMNTDELTLSAVADVDCRNLAATIPEVFTTDRLFFDAAEIDGRIDVDGHLLRFEDVNVESKIVKFSANGDARIPDPLVKVDPAGIAQDRELELIGAVDLPAIAEMLPATLRLHPDLRVDAGRLMARVNTSPTEDGRRWVAMAKVTQIAGRHRDKTIQWEDPVAIQLVANQSASAFSIDKLNCDSTFLQLEGNGDANHVEVTGTCNLNVLMANVSQFVDVGNQSIAGTMKLDGVWDRLEDQQSKVTANTTVDDFLLTSGELPPWREKHLVMHVEAQGIGTLTKPDRLNHGLFTLSSGADSMTVSLTSPTTLTGQAAIPAKVQLNGEATTWIARLSPFVDVHPWRATGQVKFDGDVNLAGSRLRIANSTIVADNLAVTNGDLVISDEHVDGRLSCDIDHASAHGFSNVALIGRSLSARASNLEFSYGDKPSVSGDVELSANLKSALRFRSGLQLAGQLTSKGVLSNSSGTTQFAVRGDVKQLQVVRPVAAQTRIAAANGPITPQSWSEPEVKFVAKGQYASPQLQLEGVTLQSNGFGITGKGMASMQGQTIDTDLTGEIGYDLAALSKAIGVVVDMDLQATGKGKQPFLLKGPINIGAADLSAIPPELEAAFGVDWQSLQYEKFRMGQGQMQAKLQKQILRVAKTTIPFGQTGKVTLRPILSFDQQQPILHLNQDTTLDNVVITPELANKWLAYVAPLLANTADINGRMSGAITQARIPLLNTDAADIAGRLQIQQALAKPGPMAQQLFQVTSQIRSLIKRSSSNSSIADKTLVKMNQQTVDFRMVNGRVYHKGLTFEVDDFPIQTSGSVGMDQSLKMTAQILIRPEWVANDRILKRLANKPLSIPIGGSLSRPVVDRAIVTNLARQIGQAATQGLIEDKLGNKLQDKLGDKLGDELGGALKGLFGGQR